MQAARAPAVPADHARRGRGHAQPHGRAGLGPRRARGGRRGRARARRRLLPRRRPAAQRRAARGDDPPRSRRRSTSSRSRSPRASAAPAAPCSPARARTSPRSTRYRRMLGGAMRQAGVLAAAGLHALEHHVDAARRRPRATRARSASGSPRSPASQVDLDRLETNIVILRLGDGPPDAATVVARAKERGVLVMAFAARTVRAVTHLDVSRDDCATAADALADCLAAAPRPRRRGAARRARCRPGGRRRRRRG